MVYFIGFLLAIIVMLVAWILKLMIKVEALDEENTELLRRIVKLEAEAHIMRLEKERKDGISAAGFRLADSLKKVKDMI